MLTPILAPIKTQTPGRLLLFTARLFLLIASQGMCPVVPPLPEPLPDVIRTGCREINTNWVIVAHKEKSED